MCAREGETAPTLTPSPCPAPQKLGGQSLWNLLCAEISVAPDVSDRLLAQLRRDLERPEARRESWRLGVAASFVQRLRASMGARAAALQAQLEAIAAILTPSQLVRYLLWVDRNKERLSTIFEATSVPAGAAGGLAGAGAAAAAAAAPAAAAAASASDSAESDVLFF